LKRQIFFVIIVLVLGLGPGLEAGEIYQWVDKNGVQHFTNEPPPPGARIISSTAEVQSDESPAPTDGTAPPEPPPANPDAAESGNPAPPVETGSAPPAPAPDDTNVDEDDGVYDDVVVRDPRLRQREELRREAETEPLRENYREEAEREDIRREADLEERRLQPETRRRLR
jgi:hypothetical protein